ncbi:MAG: hypothetical protein HS111_13120 [Kofleriaceae bacterium]|nr:hypothetical protein [Kofleriaceae bacterium]
MRASRARHLMISRDIAAAKVIRPRGSAIVSDRCCMTRSPRSGLGEGDSVAGTARTSAATGGEAPAPPDPVQIQDPRRRRISGSGSFADLGLR